MKKRIWSFTIIGVALLSSSYAVARAQAAQFSTFDDPIPGGMCGCMSCNCYFPDGLRATEATRAPMSVYIDPRSLTASLESIHDAREDAIIKAQTPSSQTTATKSTPLSSGSTVVKTGNTTSGTTKNTTSNSSSGTTVKNSSGSPDDRSSTQSLVSGSSNSSSNSSKPANTNSSASKVTGTQTSLVSSGSSKNSSGSPDDRDEAKKTTSGTSAKNSSGSPDDRDEKKSSATGKSNGTYPYDSSTGKNKTNSNVRAYFMESLGDTSNWVAPTIDKASYDPKKTTVTPAPKPQVVEHGMGDNVKTLTPITKKDPWDSFYSGFYKVDPTTGQRVVNVAPGPNLTKPEIKREVYYGPYSDKDNTKYWLDSKGDRVNEDPTKKKSSNN